MSVLFFLVMGVLYLLCVCLTAAVLIKYEFFTSSESDFVMVYSLLWPITVCILIIFMIIAHVFKPFIYFLIKHLPDKKGKTP